MEKEAERRHALSVACEVRVFEPFHISIFSALCMFEFRAWEYRQSKKIIRVSRPTRTDKAHKLGYKAKQVRFWNIDCSIGYYLFSLSLSGLRNL